MFTGIIEGLGKVVEQRYEGSNVHYTIRCAFTSELKVDQSIAHDGICLTVIDIKEDTYTVTAIQETLEKSAIKNWKIGTIINLERAMKASDRFDGHLVQGHIDVVAECVAKKEVEGSHYFRFEFLDLKNAPLVVEKGSITVNGVSLTVVQPTQKLFSVAIIPFTLAHTNFNKIEKGTQVNVEFDILGKYIAALLKKD